MRKRLAMFNKFFSFFTFKKGVPFDPKLIAKFNNDHIQLVNIAMDIKHKAEEKYAPALIRSALIDLKVELLMHFKEEEETLYKYLNVLYKDDEDKREIVQEFNDSMYAIEDVAKTFMEKYTHLSKNSSYGENFLTDLDAIIAALAHRIDTEENHLYSLYNKKSVE